MIKKGQLALDIADKHLLQSRRRIMKCELWNANYLFNKYRDAVESVHIGVQKINAHRSKPTEKLANPTS